MNIYLRELRYNLKALVIWTVVLIVIIGVASFEYEAFVDNPNLMDAMDSFEELFEQMGISVADLSEPEGFLSMMSLYFYIPLSIYAALLGSSIISKEERDRTAEYLFTLPVTRNKVIISKLLAATTYNIIINISVLLGAIVVYLRFDPSFSFFKFVFFLSIGLIITQFIFMSIGMFLSAILKQYKRSGSISLGLLLGSYMLYILIGIVNKIEFLKYLTPFKYFEVGQMLEGNIELKYVLISFVIIASCITGLFKFYEKRDLYI